MLILWRFRFRYNIKTADEVFSRDHFLKFFIGDWSPRCGATGTLCFRQKMTQSMGLNT